MSKQKNQKYRAAMKGILIILRKKMIEVESDSNGVDKLRKKIESKEENDSEYSDGSKHYENDDNYISSGGKNKIPQVTSQEELNDLVRDLGLPKDVQNFLRRS